MAFTPRTKKKETEVAGEKTPRQLKHKHQSRGVLGTGERGRGTLSERQTFLLGCLLSLEIAPGTCRGGEGKNRITPDVELCWATFLTVTSLCLQTSDDGRLTPA